MAKRSHPRRGSMAFSPRKRANRQFARVKSWANNESGDIRVQGFVGWKAGMTHVLLRDTNPNSTSAGQEIRKPVTVIEIPPLEFLELGLTVKVLTDYKQLEKFGGIVMKLKKHSLNYLGESR